MHVLLTGERVLAADLLRQYTARRENSFGTESEGQFLLAPRRAPA